MCLLLSYIPRARFPAHRRNGRESEGVRRRRRFSPVSPRTRQSRTLRNALGSSQTRIESVHVRVEVENSVYVGARRKGTFKTRTLNARAAVRAADHPEGNTALRSHGRPNEASAPTRSRRLSRVTGRSQPRTYERRASRCASPDPSGPGRDPLTAHPQVCVCARGSCSRDQLGACARPLRAELARLRKRCSPSPLRTEPSDSRP